MKYHLLLAAGLSLGAMSVYAEESPAKPYVLAGSEEFTLKSKDGETYRIMVSVPSQPAPNGGHAVAYVLDGDDLFPVLTSVLQLQAGNAKSSKHNDIQPGIIVGIGYGGVSRRDMDYTPRTEAGPPETYRDGKPYPTREYGGADSFLKFIEETLRPEIARRYPINDKNQTLVGNGFGGLFALHVLFTKPYLFQKYVASSPSIWWNNRYILEEEETFRAEIQKSGINKKVLLTVGEMEQSLTSTEASWDEDEREEHRLKVTRRKMVDNTRELYWRLSDVQTSGLEVSFLSFPGQSHKSVVPMALGQALPFIFEAEKTEP